MLDHLTCEREELIKLGKSEEDASNEALAVFGDSGEVRASITHSHLKDNVFAVAKGFLYFLLSLPVSSFLLILQVLFLFFTFEGDYYIFSFAAFMLIVLYVFFVSLCEDYIILPLTAVPPILFQCFFLSYGGVTSLVVIPEILTGNLLGFLKDIAHYENAAAPASVVMQIIFVFLFAVTAVLISVSSFFRKSRRKNAASVKRTAKKLSMSLLALIIVTSGICAFSFLFRLDESVLDYIEYWHIVPADSEAEIQDILDFYSGKTDESVYPANGYSYKISYHHDLDSSSIITDVYHNGEMKSVGWKNDEGNVELSNSWFTSSKTLFHEANGSKVVISTKNTTGYLVAVPYYREFGDTVAISKKARIFRLPLSEDVSIYGTMNTNTYEILLKK
ncbi:MAG: hypothetical protein IJL77_06480 [Clostridia bacterium]|nr:hypothetical protein [Clostridia bacterium]